MKRFNERIQEQIKKDFNVALPYIVGYYSTSKEKVYITAAFSDKNEAINYANKEGEELIINYNENNN